MSKFIGDLGFLGNIINYKCIIVVKKGWTYPRGGRGQLANTPQFFIVHENLLHNILIRTFYIDSYI